MFFSSPFENWVNSAVVTGAKSPDVVFLTAPTLSSFLFSKIKINKNQLEIIAHNKTIFFTWLEQVLLFFLCLQQWTIEYSKMISDSQVYSSEPMQVPIYFCFCFVFVSFFCFLSDWLTIGVSGGDEEGKGGGGSSSSFCIINISEGDFPTFDFLSISAPIEGADFVLFRVKVDEVDLEGGGGGISASVCIINISEGDLPIDG